MLSGCCFAIADVTGAGLYRQVQVHSGCFHCTFMVLLIASPVAYYVLLGWLQRYEYRIGVPWSVFAWSSAGALSITMLTVSFQSLKAALMDPVKSLRAD